MDHNSTPKIVVNLSKLKLSNDHISLQGLNFCPTPHETDPGQSRDDLDNLHRRLRLDYHFRPDVEDPKSDPPNISGQPNLFSTDPFSHNKFQCKSTFNPVASPTLEAMLLSNERAFNNRPTYKRPKFNNLTQGEWRALYDLK